MVNTSCIGCCLDAQSPAEKRQVRMRQWVESDKQFLRKLSTTKEERANASAASTFSPMPRPARVYPTRTNESYFCRQRYLRSYTFTKNQTVAEYAKHLLKETKSLESKTRDHLKKIFSHPVSAAAERLIAKKLPSNGFVNNTYSIKLPTLPVLELIYVRLCFRTAYIASTPGIALLFPYINQVLGVLGALNFWPLGIYFPVEMYIVQRQRRAWSRTWVVLRSFKAVCLLVTSITFVGSGEGLVSSKLS